MPLRFELPLPLLHAHDQLLHGPFDALVLVISDHQVPVFFLFLQSSLFLLFFIDATHVGLLFTKVLLDPLVSVEGNVVILQEAFVHLGSLHTHIHCGLVLS